MQIKEYLIKMKKYNNKYINDKICKIHNKENFSYCFDCCKHLCKECIKTREHAYHYKLYLEEIIPDNNILNKIEEKIIDNRAKIKNLIEKKKNKENKLDRKLNNNINKIKRAKERGIKSNKNKESKEIEKYKEEYIKEINDLKRKYENEIKQKKNNI